MPEVIISGPAGRIEGRYHQSKNHDNAPIALVLHPQPLHGGTMNNKIVYNTFHKFADNGFSVLRINFRGVGKSQGTFDNGLGELMDAAAALDWLNLHNPSPSSVWISGFSFGAWIALQLLMRRPEIEYFIAISPPVGKYDFSFLSPCPVSGLILQGDQDSVVAEEKVAMLASKIQKQKNANTQYQVISGGDHFFRTKMDELNLLIDAYIKDKLDTYKPGKSKIDRRRRQVNVE